MKHLSIVLSGLLIVCLACGCANEAGPEKKVLGVTLMSQSILFFQDLAGGLRDEAAKEGFDVRLQYCEFDSAKQVNHLDTYILQGVDAIVISPVDSASLVPAIAQARAQGIPVFTTDVRAHGADVVSHIASDNVEGGRLAGEYLASKLLNGEGKVAIIDYPEVASVQDRVKGFEEALANYPGIEIVQRVPGTGQRDKSLRAARDLLQAHPDLDAIFGINDNSALGAMAAVEAAGLDDKIVIVGYDGEPEAREAIRSGKALKADTVQYGEKIGRATVQTIAAYFRGEDVPAEVPVEVGLIDAESLRKENAS